MASFAFFCGISMLGWSKCVCTAHMRKQLKAICTTCCILVGASKDPSGAVCLVLLGHLVSCFAPGFTPVAKLIQAYLQLMAAVAESVQDTEQSAVSGEALSHILVQVSRSHFAKSRQGSTVNNAADVVTSANICLPVPNMCTSAV